MSKVIVAGGGAAGMMAACQAAAGGHQVLLLERNEKLGKKLFITGKGRCNLTNASDTDTLFQSCIRNRKFLYSSIYSFDNQAVMDFFSSHGLALKTERGGRVFPQSDHSSDVIRTLQDLLKSSGVQVRFHSRITKLLIEDGHIAGAEVSCGGRTEVFPCDSLICACGGQSYPSTGSDGQGYELARQAGHTITKLFPSLVPLNVKEDYIREMQGLSLKNVEVTLLSGSKKVYQDFGEMLFTHFGVSGPLILSASSIASDYIAKGETRLLIDLKPALSDQQLDGRLQRDFAASQNRDFKNAIHGLLPAKMIPVIIRLSGIDGSKKVNSITKEERAGLVHLLKHFPCTVIGFRGFEEAIITRGGVSVREINPSTMESKLVKGLYFAGEILDTDALTGGFNLQIAWSTGYLAGISIQ